MKILERCMIVGVISGILTIPLLIPVLASNNTDNLAWAGIIVSGGIGVIIAIIVDDRAKQANQKIVNSQATITNLLGKLDETDQKHRIVLKELKKSKEETEKISLQILEQNLNYIDDILEKIKNALGENQILPSDAKELLSKVMPNLESPLDILTQVIPHITIGLSGQQRKNLTLTVSTLRKFIILVTLEKSYDEKGIITKLIEEKEKLVNLKNSINFKNN